METQQTAAPPHRQVLAVARQLESILLGVPVHYRCSSRMIHHLSMHDLVTFPMRDPWSTGVDLERWRKTLPKAFFLLLPFLPLALPRDVAMRAFNLLENLLHKLFIARSIRAKAVRPFNRSDLDRISTHEDLIATQALSGRCPLGDVLLGLDSPT